MWMASMKRFVFMCCAFASFRSQVNAKCEWGLHFVPKFPFHTREVNFCSCYFPVLNRAFLSNMSNTNIHSLTFDGTRTMAVNSDAFLDLTLTQLSIMNNHYLLNSNNLSLQSLQNRSLHNLKHLDLSNNTLRNISQEFFSPLKGCSLQTLKLRGNKLRTFSFAVLHGLTVHELDISKNQIMNVDLNFTFLPGLNNLFLSFNFLVSSPNFCNATNKIALPDLKNLDLRGNKIRGILKPSHFICLDNVKILSLADNYINLQSNYTFTNMKNLQILKLHNSRINHYKFASRALWNLSNLVELTFQSNNFNFKKLSPRQIKEVFKGLPKLSDLDLQQNTLPSESEILQKMFRPLSNLQTLNLGTTNLKTLPTGVFSFMKKLKKLVLQGNSVNKWPSGEAVFGRQSSLKSLYLNENKIVVFNKSSVPQNILNNLINFSLAGNPLSCTCDQAWLAEWMRSTKVHIINYPQKYVCKYPPSMRATNMKDYNPSSFECFSKTDITLLVIGINTGLIVIIGFIYYCFRRKLDYIYIRITSRYSPLESDHRTPMFHTPKKMNTEL